MLNSICLFGDSIGRGVIYNAEKQAYSISGRGFAKLFGKENGVKVNNFSKFGCTVSKGLSILERNIGSLKECDLVILEYGGNDCDFKWNEIAEKPDVLHICNTPLEEFVALYKQMISKITAYHKRVVVLNLPPIDADKYFAWISRGINGENIKKWLGGKTDYIYRWHESYSNAVASMAREMNVFFADIRSKLLVLRNYTECICDDGIHPNEKGHELICNTLNNELLKFI